MDVPFRAGEAVIWWKRKPNGDSVPLRATVLAVTTHRVKISVADDPAGSELRIRNVTRKRLQPIIAPDDLDTVRRHVTELLAHVGPQATDRQLRLFAAGCCRLGWDRVIEEPSRH